ncbi:MAG: VanZ family protein [Lachnospiraceae bacterium]|nr:VanZ family protein [Lachnospiraceae bacterium]
MIALDLHMSSFLVLYFCLTLIEVLLWRKRKKKNISFGGLMIISLYVLILFKLTICPIVIIKGQNRQMFMDAMGNQLQHLQLIPFRTIMSTIFKTSGLFQIVGNIFLLFPIPILCSLIGKVKDMRKWCIIGGGVSLCIEIVQLMINKIFMYPSHVADIDDLILNLSGVFLGALLSAFFYDKAVFAKVKSYMVVTK